MNTNDTDTCSHCGKIGAPVRAGASLCAECEDRYGSKRPDGQFERHPKLSPQQIAKFVRPVRTAYRHVGARPTHPTRPLTAEERERYSTFDYFAFEQYPPEKAPLVGKFWTAEDLSSGCGQITHMQQDLAETYAADPGFYSKTFCAKCRGYFPVGIGGEFVWIEADGRDGMRVGT